MSEAALCCQQSADTIYDWSNTGPCVSLFAPGVQIYSACGAASKSAFAPDDADRVAVRK
jgi:hypothetical protein